MFIKKIYFFFALLFFCSCREKKTILLSGDVKVTRNEFIEFFPATEMPFIYSDTLLAKKKKENDSLLISYKVFTDHVHDSVITGLYGKNANPKIYALGKATGPNQEILLFVKTIHKQKDALILFGFNKDNSFCAAMPVLSSLKDPSTYKTLVVDKRLIITLTTSKKNADGSLSEGKDVYAFNADSKMFYTVMTDPLADLPEQFINPIDTFPATQKWTGDYGPDKKNLISIRNGRSREEITFFIHLEKDDGQCNSELKGEARFTSANTAEYHRDGDPCKLRFRFTSSSVQLEEMEGCGSYRHLHCTLNGIYPRKKISKPNTSKPVAPKTSKK
ncbi:MAG: hypothetical protein N2747_02360 [Chitinophagaceae bacterium]|nr:hypothetical protein [Chitinophagaceae bacterium]